MAGKHFGGRGRKSYSHRNRHHPYDDSLTDIFTKNLQKFVYGNFHYYYGYRNQDASDNRLTCMKREWLTGKAVLDIGCNAGHVTLSVARDFAPKFIIGIDIDGYLIRVARKNAVYYINDDVKYSSVYPLACISKFGPVAQGVLSEYSDCMGQFPFNISFIQGNYVLDSDELLAMQQPEFDCIMCLSVTKWIHLNWGDEGMQRTFLRIFAHLKPGGFLILEPQPFSSYRKKKNMAESIRENFMKIKFFPEQFNEYLLNVVGFESCELIDTPAHSSKGFCRPLYLFKKADAAPKHIFFNHDIKPLDRTQTQLSDSDDYFSDCEELSD